MDANYPVVIEQAGNNLSAFSPDIPGCAATGSSREEVRERMAIAIRMHLDGLIEDGLPIPAPMAVSESVAPSNG